MIGEWEAPVQRLSQQLDELKLTLKSIDQSKNQLRPELERMTIELTSLLGAQNSKVEPLLEFPKILKSILSNKKVGAMVFGPDGEKLLYNERAQHLLSGLGDFNEKGPNRDSGFFKADGATQFQSKELPWFEALSGHAKKLEDTEMIVKRPGKEDQPVWLRVTVSTLAGAESGEIGGAIAFLADITEHVAVVNELSAICSELEQKLSNFTLASKELEMLSRKLSQVRSQDMELANQASKDNQNRPANKRVISSNGRVLVADDVAVNQKLLKLQLERMGFEVTLVKSGVEAVEAVKASHFDLILMDCDMPELDGYEATEQIRTLGSNKSGVPIIAVTAYDREGDREKCLASGMNDFITKGSPENLLRQAISKWLNAAALSNSEEDSDSVSRARVVLFDEDKGEHSRSLTVDINDLEDTYGGSETESILRLFLGVSSTFVDCLELAVESKDAEAVSHFAYSLKGPCASLNLTHLANLATQLAQLGVNSKWHSAEEIYQQLKSAYAPIQKQVSEILTDLPTSTPEGSN
ncbi:MAG: response regulator [Candidatus Melainabacteria bacterium]|nr:response regulator [Candidatus Melainabacteria bacterium]